MPWTSEQLPWAFLYPNPARPDGPWEVLNWMKGPPVLAGGGGPLKSLSGQPLLAFGSIGPRSSPPPLHGRGLRPYYPNRVTLHYQYNVPVMPSIGRVLLAQRLR